MDPNLYTIYRSNMKTVCRGNFDLAERQANDYLNYMLGWNFPQISKEMLQFHKFLELQVRSH